jgi:hypothetical protein
MSNVRRLEEKLLKDDRYETDPVKKLVKKWDNNYHRRENARCDEIHYERRVRLALERYNADSAYSKSFGPAPRGDI